MKIKVEDKWYKWNERKSELEAIEVRNRAWVNKEAGRMKEKNKEEKPTTLKKLELAID